MKTMAGVALAAVVGACALAGGVERAEAYFINVSGSATSPNNDYATIDFSFDTTGKSAGSGSFSFQRYAPGDDNGYFLTSDSVYGNQRKISCGTGCYSEIFSAVFYNVKFVDSSISQTTPPISGDITVGLAVTHYFNYPEFGTDITVSLGDERGGAYGSVNFGAGYEISAVPIPATASLFGVALLALGGLGYARRRAISV